MGNSRSFQPPSGNTSLPNIKISHNSNIDPTYEEDKEGYRQSVSSLPLSHKKPFMRAVDLKSPKGSISFTQGLTNNANTNKPASTTSNSKLPPLNNKPTTSLSTPPSLDTLSSIDQSSLNLRQAKSNDSLLIHSSTTNCIDTSPKTLQVNIENLRAASPLQFGRRTSSTQALNSLAKSPTKIQATSPKNFTLQQQQSNNSKPNKNTSSKNESPTLAPLGAFPNMNALNNTLTATTNGNEELGSLQRHAPNLNNSRDKFDENSPDTPTRLISTNSMSLITTHKRAGGKLMFDRDVVNNNNVSKFEDCDTGSEISRQEDEQPLILSTTLDVDMMMKQKKLASISTPPRSHTSNAFVESPNVLFETPPDKKATIKNIVSAPNLLSDSLSHNRESGSFIDSIIEQFPSTDKGNSAMKRSVDADDILDDILREKPTLKSLKKLKSENSVRKRAGSLNNSKVRKSGGFEKNSKYLRETDGISSNIMNILKGCEDLLGDLELEPKCSCKIEVTQPDTSPETNHLLPLQNSRRFNLLTVPDPKQVMRESRSEQKQHEKKQKSVNKEVANIIKDIRSSFSEFDF